jgi:tetratricopeptide (TPR) repeat protein
MSHRAVNVARRSVLALCSLGVASISTLPALSQSDDAAAICTGRSSASADERVRACSSLIDSRAFNGDQLAILYTSRGSAWRSQGNPDRALADQNEAVSLQPDSAIVHFNRAVTWQSKQQADRAISDYGEAIRLAPDFAMAYKNRGDTFFAIADYDRAIADYDTALRLQPQYAEGVARRGLAKLRKGDPNGGNADIRAAREIDPAIIPVLFGPRGIASSMVTGLLVRNDMSVFTALELSDASICLQTNAVSEQQLGKYFDSRSMKVPLRTFPSFDEAREAYDRRECDVLAANIADLGVARRKLSDPEAHHPLPEVFAATSPTKALETKAPPPAQANRLPRPDFWDYSGSTLSLVADGNKRKFYYVEPHTVFRKMGVTPGTLFFEGTRAGKSYQGTTYVFSDHCKPLAYTVSGVVSNDDRKVTLVGKVPVRDGQCQVVTHMDHTMEIVFHDKVDNWGASLQ